MKDMETMKIVIGTAFTTAYYIFFGWGIPVIYWLDGRSFWIPVLVMHLILAVSIGLSLLIMWLFS